MWNLLLLLFIAFVKSFIYLFIYFCLPSLMWCLGQSVANGDFMCVSQGSFNMATSISIKLFKYRWIFKNMGRFLKENFWMYQANLPGSRVWFDRMGTKVVFSLILLERGRAWGGIVSSYGSKTDYKLILTMGIWNLWQSNPSENWVLLGKKRNSPDTLAQMHFCRKAGQPGERNFTLGANWGGRCKEVRKMSFKWEGISCISWFTAPSTY